MTMPIPTEEVEQRMVVQYCALKGYPLFHVPNSTYTKSWLIKNRNTALGVSSGVPDLAVILRGNGSPKKTKFLLFIEMKRRTGGKVSKEQEQWIERLNEASNVFAAVCYGADDAIRLIESYGEAYKKLYPVYSNILARCNRKSHQYYAAYGGRGIRNEFDGFREFFDWAMKSGYQPGMTVERVDNDDNYSEDNCIFADMETQSNNRRSNLRLTAFGKTQTLQQWSRETGIKRETIKRRLTLGWDIQKALTVTPIIGRNQSSKNKEMF